MQKLPEASDKKKGRRIRKENGTSRQKEEAHSFSDSDQRSANTLLTAGTPRVRLWTTRWLVLSLVALVYQNIKATKWTYQTTN